MDRLEPRPMSNQISDCHHRLTVVAMGDRVSVCLRREGFQTQTNQCEFLIALRKVPPSPEHLYQYTRRGLHLYSVIGRFPSWVQTEQLSDAAVFAVLTRLCYC